MGGAARRALAAAAAALALAASARAQVDEGFANGANVVLDVRGAALTCLTLQSDLKNTKLTAECSGSNAAQVWYYYKDGRLGTGSAFLSDFSDNGGAVQVQGLGSVLPSGAKANKWDFLSGGRIRSQGSGQCLDQGFYAAGPPETRFLKLSECGSAPGWKLVGAQMPSAGSGSLAPQVLAAAAGASSVAPQVVSAPQVVAAAPQAQAQAVQVVPVASLPAPQVVPAVVQGVAAAAGGAVPQVVSVGVGGVTKGAVMSRGGQPQTTDHYLCACVISKDDDVCIAAVKAACTVGHIPSDLCSESFEQGQHDRISKHVVQVIERGAKCPSADMDKLRSEVAQAQLPTARFSGQQVVTAEDHYLCVCLSNTEGVDAGALDKQCEDAVKVACMVGHIPEPDCYASFDDKQHGQVVKRVMEMIDSGANCAKRLERSRSATCKNPPCYNTAKASVKKEPHYLCVCLQDHQSVICIDAVKRACEAGSIPRADCELALKAGYRTGVTRHVMHLIDHGSECGVGGPGLMTFTNHRCHCKQKWTAPNGEVLQFPDNCRDPGASKGFSWCETYAEEECVGEGESMSWDRCDRPQLPRYHLGDFAQTAVGKITPVDHYLCPCVVTGATDEMCQAAVKAACMVGHLSADACQESFQEQNHAKVSDQILKQINHGARCVNGDVVAGPNSGRAKALAGGPTDADGVPLQTFQTGCGHGQELANGACACDQGFAGQLCDYCADGFVGYPACVAKLDCTPACRGGTCDLTHGKCQCPANRVGDLCEICAWGYSGLECEPEGMVYTATHSVGFWVLVLAVTSYFFCCTKQGAQLLNKALAARTGHMPGGAYSRLNNDAAFIDAADSHKQLDVEQDAEAPMVPSAKTQRPLHKSAYSGLAI